MNVILDMENKSTVDKMTEFVEMLTAEEQKQMNVLVKGIELGITLAKEKTA